MYIDFGCLNFDCYFKLNLISDKIFYGVVVIGNIVFIIVFFVVVILYIFFIGFFFIVSCLDLVLVCFLEILMIDINKSDVWLLFLVYVLIIVLFLGLGVLLYILLKGSEI